MSTEGDAIKKFFVDHGWKIDILQTIVYEDSFYTSRGQCTLWVFMQDGMLNIDEKSYWDGKTKHHGSNQGRFELASPDCLDDIGRRLEEVMGHYEY